MIISLSGAPGSGKSTIAQMLAKKLNWPRYYMGSIWREMAKKHGVDVVTYSKMNENNPDKDKEVDEYQRKLGQEQDNFIIEGRTSWYFIPNSLKIYLDVNNEEGAKRIFSSLQKGNSRNEANNLTNWQEVMASTRERIECDDSRYFKYYNIHVFDPANYDFYLDTSNLTPQQVFDQVYIWVAKHLDNRKN